MPLRLQFTPNTIQLRRSVFCQTAKSVSKCVRICLADIADRLVCCRYFCNASLCALACTLLPITKTKSQVQVGLWASSVRGTTSRLHSQNPNIRLFEYN